MTTKDNLIKQITDIVVESNPEEYVEQTGDNEWSLKRPLNLEDVLIASENKMKFNASWEPLENFIKKLLLPFYDQGKYRNARYWQLGKPLHEQKFETLEFILSVLE